jgi:large subunit ribosomal protein L18
MNPQKQKRQARIQRHKRVRSRIFGTAGRPRLCVFRSNRFIEIQLIDDEKSRTLLAARVSLKDAHKGGLTIAQKAKEKHITRAVFDRGGYAYHGHVKEVAEGARKNGLIV